MLRPDTAVLWEHLKEHAGLSGFILVGGTALSMQASRARALNVEGGYLFSPLRQTPFSPD